MAGLSNDAPMCHRSVLAPLRLRAACRSWVPPVPHVIIGLGPIRVGVDGRPTLFFDPSKGPAGLGKDGFLAGALLPATDRRIDEPRLDLHREGAPTGLLRGHNRRARSGKGIEHDVAAA